MKNTVRRRLVLLVLLLAYFVLMYGAFSNLLALQAIYPAVSLRYTDRISQASALEAQKYAVKQAEEDKEYWPTFWAADSLEVTAEQKTMEVPSLAYYGAPELVMPVDFIRGGYPGMADKDGCVVSEQLAWQLWGSGDVLGLSLTIEGRQAVVRGVFAGKKPELLWGAGEAYEKGWQNVELQGETNKDARTEAASFATASGLGTPHSIVSGSFIQFWAGAMVALPMAAGLIWCLALLYKNTPQEKRRYFGVVALLAAACVAVFLPQLLGALPPWLLPTKWSDFSFWGSLFQRIGGWLWEWLLLIPFAKDAQAKLKLVMIAVQSALCLPLLVAIGRQMIQQRVKENPKESNLHPKPILPVEAIELEQMAAIPQVQE